MDDHRPHDELKSVNWLTGMLLTPQHFERQDRFAEETARWAVRYALPHHGLVGGGLRVDPHATALVQFDPRFEVEDDGTTVHMALLFARGVTPAGEVVDIAEPDIVSGEVLRTELAGQSGAVVSVVREGVREEDRGSIGLDAANPHQAALRRVQYRLVVGGAADVQQHALVVGRVRRVSETLGFDRDGDYIPPCVAVLAHSVLYAGWVRLLETVTALAERFSELHKAVATYAERLASREVDVRGDLDTLAFVERAVLALDECAYEVIDPACAPSHVFQQVERLGRRVAIALDLSAATRLFLRAVSETDAGYEVLLDEERQARARRRGWHAREDVSRALETARQTVDRVRDLCAVIEGKYLDYRINPNVGALRFLIERGGEGFYTAVGTPGHVRRVGNVLTFDFSPLALPARQEYLVLLQCDASGGSPWQVGEQLDVDVWVNPAPNVQPISRTVRCEVLDQRNFAVKFDPPLELTTVAALRVTVHDDESRVRQAVLYHRHRGRALKNDGPPVAVASAATPVGGRDDTAATPPPPSPSPAPGQGVPRLKTIPLRKPPGS